MSKKYLPVLASLGIHQGSPCEQFNQEQVKGLEKTRLSFTPLKRKFVPYDIPSFIVFRLTFGWNLFR